ncbi:hypothetical protein DSL92_08770 [Billgrantia gudaonensis]|uniref:Uncharacterized protein n=1 Tax=Billgrantia gudaonensis TaxID=376427 RepID=A0A432JI09_9GAMM|nr:hypothetical protein DSL92_08770 [Halomonas gudaonensis]
MNNNQCQGFAVASSYHAAPHHQPPLQAAPPWRKRPYERHPRLSPASLPLRVDCQAPACPAPSDMSTLAGKPFRRIHAGFSTTVVEIFLMISPLASSVSGLRAIPATRCLLSAN